MKGQQRGSSFATVMQLDSSRPHVGCLDSVLKPDAAIKKLTNIFHTCKVTVLTLDLQIDCGDRLTFSVVSAARSGHPMSL